MQSQLYCHHQMIDFILLDYSKWLLVDSETLNGHLFSTRKPCGFLQCWSCKLYFHISVISRNMENLKIWKLCMFPSPAPLYSNPKQTQYRIEGCRVILYLHLYFCPNTQPTQLLFIGKGIILLWQWGVNEATAFMYTECLISHLTGPMVSKGGD